MTKKSKSRIPDKVSALVLFEADLTCCICKDRHKPVQIHHLDCNSSNNDLSNLVVLCLDHHDEVTRGPGLGRGLSADLIEMYHKNWCETLRAKRRKQFDQEDTKGIGFDSDQFHQTLIDAVACHELRRHEPELICGDWRKSGRVLSQLHAYSLNYFGPRVKAVMLDILYSMASRTRMAMPPKVADEISILVIAALPTVSLVCPSEKKLSKKEEECLHLGVSAGECLTYDGIKYRKNMKIITSGTRVMWTVLRYAHLNDLAGFKKKVLESFAQYMQLAEKTDFHDAKRWIEFEKDDALTLNDDDLPQLP